MKLRWCEIPKDLYVNCILLSAYDEARANEIKWTLLEKMGIERDASLTPHKAWLKALCEENGLEFTIPIPKELSEAITHNAGASQFSFFLA